MAQLPDEVLLDFDTKRLARWKPGQGERLLIEHPELYRNHLAVARGLTRWAVQNEETLAPAGGSSMGYQRALRDVAAHLRQGDYLPGATVFEEWTGGHPSRQ